MTNAYRSRYAPDQPQVVNPATGEALSMAEVNSRILRLADDLERKHQPALEALLTEYTVVSLRYELTFAASVKASGERSEDRRRAEALVHVDSVPYAEGERESLAHRKAVLEMQIKASREASHNVRAQLSGLQSVGANLRVETSLGGIRP